MVARTTVIFLIFVLPRERLGFQAATDFDPQLYVTIQVTQTDYEKICRILSLLLTLARVPSVRFFHHRAIAHFLSLLPRSVVVHAPFGKTLLLLRRVRVLQSLDA